MAWTDWMNTQQAAEYVGYKDRGSVSRILSGKRGEGKLADYQYEAKQEGQAWTVRFKNQSPRTEDAEVPEERDDWVLPDHDPKENWVETDSYIYDGDRDVYIVVLPNHKAPFVRPGDWVRAVWRKYTQKTPIDQMTRDFGIDRQTFVQFKRKVNLTQTRSPFTDEEIASNSIEDLAEDALRIKERELATKIERKHWKQIKKDAQKYREGVYWIDEVCRRIDRDPIELPPPRKLDRSESAIYVGATDLHIGKKKSAISHTVHDQEEQLFSLIANMREPIEMWGAPDRFILPIGHDALHFDTTDLETERGTPQGSQSSCGFVEASDVAERVYRKLIDTLAEYAPVDCYWVPGNHDYGSSRWLAMDMRSSFRNYPDRIKFDVGGNGRKYTRHGNVPIGMTHGDKEKHVKLAQLMSVETGWSTKNALWFVAHTHGKHALMQEEGGVVIHTSPSPARSDRYHVRYGYVGNQECVGLYAVHPVLNNTDIAWVTGDAIDE